MTIKAKPIFVIRMPSNSSPEAMMVMAEDAKKNMNDYHVLCVRDMWDPEKLIKFEVFNADSIKNTEFESLQKKLLILAKDPTRYEIF